MNAEEAEEADKANKGISNNVIFGEKIFQNMNGGKQKKLFDELINSNNFTKRKDHVFYILNDF